MKKVLIITAIVSILINRTISVMACGMSSDNEYYCTKMTVKDATAYGSTLIDENGEAWLENVQLEVGSKWIVIMDDMNTDTLYDDEIVGIVVVD